MSVLQKNTFPHDIWLQIASYLPPSQIQQLLNLNSTFFHIAMDGRYRQMSFAYLDNRMIRSLARLTDPAVAKRVRILHVYPGFLMDALNCEVPDELSFIPSSNISSLRRTLKCRILELALYLSLLKQPEPTHPKLRMMRLFKVKRSEDLVHLMLQVLSNLPNVTDYYVSWHCAASNFAASSSLGGGATASAAGSLLESVLMRLGDGSSLRKLCLELSLENVRCLISDPKAFAMHRLEELTLSIHHTSYFPVEVLSTHLAPAINSLHSTLRILSIQSLTPPTVDLSAMFLSLDTLSALEELSVSIPVETPHLGDPMAFRSFLNKQSRTLKTLRMKANRTSGTESLSIPGVLEESFDHWVKSVFGGHSIDVEECSIPPLHLPALKHLDITSTLFPVSTSEYCLRHFHLYGSSGLNSVSLTGAYRCYEDIRHALEVFSPSSEDAPSCSLSSTLTKLRIGLVSLSPQLIDLIARKLPQLERLEILVKYILPDVQECPEMTRTSGSQTEQTSTQIDSFLDNVLATRSYPDWSLRHLGILAESLPSRTTYEPLLEQVFLTVVPGLRRAYTQCTYVQVCSQRNRLGASMLLTTFNPDPFLDIQHSAFDRLIHGGDGFISSGFGNSGGNSRG